jgi:ubiquinone/menaquinone biosynthesis C-methylase UbiE
MYDQYFEANKKIWNQRAMIHKDSAFYNVEGFRAGKNVLTKIELEELGDVRGKSMLHLQCHFGLDTLNWARLGAEVTGVDLSDDAIRLAQQLGEELHIDGRFICCNLYDLPQHLDQQFDIVFTSYGAIGWLPELEPWAAIVNRFLKPGGVFYIAEFHPTLWMMDEKFEYIKYNYFNKEVISEETQGTYADPNAPIKMAEYSWNHPFCDIINALTGQGLRIRHLNEFPFSPYNIFHNNEQGADGFWRIKGLDEKMPVMYSIKATKD